MRIEPVVGEQKVNCPLYEGPSEPSVRNFKTGGNDFTINNYPDPSIKYISLDSKRLMIFFFAGTTSIYWTVDFFHYDTSNKTGRVETIFWPATKSFVSLKRQVIASGNTHISPL